MKLIHGLLNYADSWAEDQVYLFTGNSVIKNNGAIVMGRGAAKQVRDTYPGIDKAFGTAIGNEPSLHVLVLQRRNPRMGSIKIGWFKVKHHWADNAEPALIAESATRLAALAEEHPELTWHMNYPGIGNGGLTVADVSNLLEILPDNVLIYR
jgi:hypothetical protein